MEKLGPDPVTTTPYAKGWLRFLAIWLRVLFPIQVVVGFVQLYAYMMVRRVSDLWLVFGVLYVLLLITEAYRSGTTVLMQKPGFADRGKIFLWFVLAMHGGTALITITMASLMGVGNLSGVTAKSIGAMLGMAVQPVCWLAYLYISKQVASLAAWLPVDRKNESWPRVWLYHFYIPVGIGLLLTVILRIATLAEQGDGEHRNIVTTATAPSYQRPTPAPDYEALAASVQAGSSKAISEHAPVPTAFNSRANEDRWVTEMSQRLEKRIIDRETRMAFLNAVHYEATRSGLDPQLVLGLIDVVSGFKKYAVSEDGARGYMQVMPDWIQLVGAKGDDLFDMRKNIRYGCVILRHYLDLENGNLYRALVRYESQMRGFIEASNHSYKYDPSFVQKVDGALKTRWRYDGPLS